MNLRNWLFLGSNAYQPALDLKSVSYAILVSIFVRSLNCSHPNFENEVKNGQLIYSIRLYRVDAVFESGRGFLK